MAHAMQRIWISLRCQSPALTLAKRGHFGAIAAGRRTAEQASVRFGPIEKPQSAGRSRTALHERCILFGEQLGNLHRDQGNQCARALDARLLDKRVSVVCGNHFKTLSLTGEQLIECFDLIGGSRTHCCRGWVRRDTRSMSWITARRWVIALRLRIRSESQRWWCRTATRTQRA